MPRQTPPYITGTFNGMCYYKMDGIYYVRKCPEVSKRKRKEAPSYEKQRQWNGHFTDCTKLSSALYKQVPKEKRTGKLQQKGTGLAVRMTKEGKSKTEIEQALMQLMGLSVIKKEVSMVCEQVIEGQKVVLEKRSFIYLASPNGKGGWHYQKGRLASSYRNRVMDEEALEQTMRGENELKEINEYLIPVTHAVTESKKQVKDPVIENKLFVANPWPGEVVPMVYKELMEEVLVE